MKDLLKQLRLDNIYGCDYETFWSDEFSLKKIPTTEYIYDDRFEAQIVSVQAATWSKPRVMEIPAFLKWSKTIDWSKAGWLSHNTAFDGLIASRHHAIKPAFYFDTLSMARPLLPVQVGGSLFKLCAAFGREAKKHGASLLNTKGKRWAEFSAAEKREHKRYAGDDIEDCWFLFHKLLPYTTVEELRIIDLTLKMYCQPSVLLDKALLEELARTEIERKAELLQRYDKDDLMSNDKFALILSAALNDKPPTKISKSTQKETWAFAKTDLEFKDLLDHPDPEVSTLVEARLGVKSTIVETRAQRLAKRADYGPQPVFLNYWGAATGRWSGGDKINWQNFSRGSDMRKAVYAPKGHMLVIADLAQIEARLVAWFAGQDDILQAFADGEDVYCLAASRIYGRKITKADAAERFVGKVATLALGYQAGWSRFANMLRIGQFGPPLNISDMEAQAAHAAWRRSNPFIVANWKATQARVQQAFLGRQQVEDRCVVYEGVGSNGFMHLPNGTSLRYDDVQVDEEGLNYLRKKRGKTEIRGRLYGGLEVENRTQALARIVVAEHMISIADQLPYWRQAMTTHDEIVGVVPTRYAKRALRLAQEVMATPPSWAPDLPLAVDAHISHRYDK